MSENLTVSVNVLAEAKSMLNNSFATHHETEFAKEILRIQRWLHNTESKHRLAVIAAKEAELQKAHKIAMAELEQQRVNIRRICEHEAGHTRATAESESFCKVCGAEV